MMWPITRYSRTNPHRRTAAITRTHKCPNASRSVILMNSWIPGQAVSSRLAGSRIMRGAMLAAFFSALPLQYTKAHDPGLSSLTIRQRTNQLEAILTMAVKDAAQVAGVDEN